MSLFAKIWTDVLGDPKLMRGARKGARQLVLLPWFVVFAKHAEDNGRLTVNGEPAEPCDLSRLIPGVTDAQVTTGLRSLLDLGVLTQDDDGAYRFANWQHRSGEKPSASAPRVKERVAQHRARVRAARAESADDVTPVTPSVTPGPSNVGNAQGNATEQEQEQEQEERARVEITTSVVIALAREANRGLAEHAKHPQPIPRIIATNGKTRTAAEAILGSGVPLDFACAAIYELAKTHGSESPVQSLGYFTAAVMRRWGEHQAALEVQGTSAPSLLPRVERPRATTQGGARNDAALDGWMSTAEVGHGE